MTNTNTIINANYKFTTLQVSYTYWLDASNWDGAVLNEDDIVARREFAANSQTTLAYSWVFESAVDVWNAYSVIDFTENSQAADIVVYQAEINDPVEIGPMHNVDPNNPSYGFTYLYNSVENIVFDDDLSINSSYGLWTSLHELGHALGLEHPDNNGYNPAFNSNMTVMSYNVLGNRYPITPMALDVAALEALYGQSATYDPVNVYHFDAASDAVVAFNGSHRAKTLVDTGGENTFNLTNASTAATIDLREAVDAQGNWHDYATLVNDEITYIARGTTIHNAVGTAFDDTITGNDADNELLGGAGNDTYVFSGAYGDDVIEDADSTGSIVIGGLALSGLAEATGEGLWSLVDAHGRQFTLRAEGTDALLNQADASGAVVGNSLHYVNIGLTFTQPHAVIL
jgi:Peptidase M10 serralysin C terminal